MNSGTFSGRYRATGLALVALLCVLPSHLAAREPEGSAVRDTGEFDDFNFDSIPVDVGSFRRSISLAGQVRFRTEIDRRNPFELMPEREEAFDYHLLRTRVSLTIRPLPDVTGLIQAQDSRTFGSSGNTLGVDPNAFDLHQAWVRVDDFVVDGTSITLGRQELSYANERLIGAVGWHNRGRAFDALKIRSEFGSGSVDLFASRTNDRTGTSSRADRGNEHLFGIWGTVRPSDRQTVDLFVLYDNDNTKLAFGPDSGSDLRNRGTYGVRWLGSVSSLTFELEGAYQSGEQVPVPDAFDSTELVDIAAYMASARASLRVGTTDIGLLYTRLSGDDDPTDGEINTFNTLFATNHKFYGAMDYFPGVSSGLQDIALLLGLWTGERTSLSVDGHYFLPADSGDPYGIEVDLTATHRYNDAVTFQAGASLFLPDGIFAAAFDDRNGYWGFLMVTVGL